MLHFKNPAGDVFAYDADQPHLVENAQSQGWQELAVWPPAPTLEAVKESKLSELRSARTAASNADVTVSGSTFTAEPDTQTGFKRLADRMRRGKPSSLTAILDAAGNPVPVNLALLDAIEDAIAANTEAAWNKYGMLAGQVNAAATTEAVNAVVW